MELALDGILETLLVGSVASLCLLGLLFLVLPDLIRVEMVRRLFTVMLYEERKAALSAKTTRNPGRATSASDPSRIFASLLLVAAVYGAGIVAEALSDTITSRIPPTGASSRFLVSDPEIRTAAFVKVGRTATNAGNVTPQFARFIADFAACRFLPASYKPFSTTCKTIDDRAHDFYYTAKNTVYHEPTYFDELSHLQNRIDFTRAMSQALALLALILSAGAGLGAVAEFLNSRKSPLTRPNTFVGQLVRHGIVVRAFRSAWVRDGQNHWLNLDAARLLGTALLVLSVAWLSQTAWHENEDEFDARVFGYFLAHAATSVPCLGATSEQTTRVDRTFWPVTPYHLFELEPGERFEPSALEALGDGRRVIVSNDKGHDNPFVIFDFDESRGFTEPRLVEGLGIGLGKMESLHVEETGAGFHVLAASTFEHGPAGKAGLVSFYLDENGQPLGPARSEPIDNPCAVLSKTATCKVEGLAYVEQEKTIYLGVRTVDGTPTIAVLRATQEDERWVPTLVFDLTLGDDFPKSGVSALAFDRDGNLLVLTTTEEDGSIARANQVSGALWRIPKQHVESARRSSFRLPKSDELDRGKDGASYLLQTFIHKPEGMTVLDSHAILVVFDDDGARKSRTYAPDTFPLDQHQSVFTVARAEAP